MSEKIKFNPGESGEQSLSPESEEHKSYTFQVDPPGMRKDLFVNSLKKGGGSIYFTLKNTGEITLSFNESDNSGATHGIFSLKDVGNIHDEKWQGTVLFSSRNKAGKAQDIESGIMDFLGIRDKQKDMAPHKVK